MIAFAVPFGLLVGLSMGMLGGGGSVLAVPVFVYVLGQSVPDATTGSLVVVAAASLVGVVSHARAGRVCWRHAASFTAAAVPGVFAGTAVADAVGERTLLAGFAFVMVAAAAATLRKTEGIEEDAEERKRGPSCPPVRIPRDVFAGLIVGTVTGFFGVGGGFLIVPTLAIALAFTMRTAVGTSLAIITGTSLVAVAVHLASGRSVDPALTVAMAAACAAGAAVGAAVAGRVPQRVLGRGFAGMVLAVAAYLVVSVTVAGGPPGT